MRAFGARVFTALLSCGAVAQAPLLPPPALLPPVTLAPPALATQTSIQGYGERDTGCAEWTDRCRTCRRSGTGAHACSNIGPACQPAVITCVRKVAPAAPQ